MHTSAIRSLIIEELELLSLPSMQLAYEVSLVKAGHAPTELLSRFCDDLFNPKNPEFIAAFSNEELKQLAHLYGLILDAFPEPPSSVVVMPKNSAWRKIISLAKELHAQFIREA